MPMLGIMASSISGSKAVTNSYESIATVTVGTAVSSISFSSIPSTYKHLQIRAFARSSVQARLRMQLNGDTGNNYAVHFLMGDGATASAAAAASTNQFGMASSQADANIFCVNVIDLLDYSNTNKYKTARILEGNDKNASGGEVALWSGLWMNTAAISSATMYFDSSANIAQYSHFALYGIKG
jgi:hypothetical protein